MSLRAKTISGIIWNFTELMLRRGVAVFTTVILAWFLAPEDFGMLAMMTVFLALANVLTDAGFSQALIRKEIVSKREFNTAFYTNIVMALLIYIVLILLAPWISTFYSQPELDELIRVAGIAILFNSLSLVQQVVLTRELKFKLQMQVTVPASLLSGAGAIVCAFYGLGAWALVSQLVVQSMVTTIFYWRLGLWRPGFDFGWREFKEIFSFGGYLLMEHMISVLFKNMYIIVISKLFLSSIAGLYFFSEKVRDLLVQQLVSTIETVSYPALSQIQNDVVKSKLGYRHIICLTTFLVFPVLIFLAVLIDIIITLFLPEAWWQASEYIQLMCYASLFAPLNAINLNILKVKGRSDLIFYLGIVKKIVAISIFLVTYQYGISAIITGQVMASILAYLPNSYYSKKFINYSVKEQVSDFLPYLLLAGGGGFCIWLMQLFIVWNNFLELLFLCLSGVLAYLLGAWVLRLNAVALLCEIFDNRTKGNMTQ